MKRYLFSPLVILSLLTFVSCQGQVDNHNKSVNQEGDAQVIAPKNADEDFDQYFVEKQDIFSLQGPTSITRNILQDRKGNYWLASWEGIVQYDGKIYTNHTLNDSLRKYHVFSLMEDSKGNLWFGTIGAGVFRYDGDTFVNITSADGLAGDNVECITEDRNGDIWFGTEKGMSRYNGATFQNYTVEDGLTSNDVHSIVEDSKGHLWIGSREGVCVFNGKTITAVSSDTGITFNNAWSILVDSGGGVWITGNDGLWYYNGIHYTNITTNFVGFVYQVRSGDILFNQSAKDANIMYLKRYPHANLPEPVDSSRVEEVMRKEGLLFGIYQGNDDRLWLGSLGGVILLDGADW